MDKKLITIDLDGTTLDKNSKLSNTTIKTIKAASDAGHIVSIVTGRPYRMSKHIYNQLGLTTPMANFNGALTHVPDQEWEHEYSRTINKAIVYDLLKNKDKFKIKVMALEHKNYFLSDKGASNLLTEFFPSKIDPENLLTKEALKHNPNSVTVVVDPVMEQTVKNQILHYYGDYVHVGVWGGPNSVLEVVSKGINKAKSVAYLSDYFNIDKRNIIAFGDEHNDAEMLDYAGWGVALKNANDNIKSISNDITEFNHQDDGLAKYLQEYLKLEV